MKIGFAGCRDVTEGKIEAMVDLWWWWCFVDGSNATGSMGWRGGVGTGGITAVYCTRHISLNTFFSGHKFFFSFVHGPVIDVLGHVRGGR